MDAAATSATAWVGRHVGPSRGSSRMSREWTPWSTTPTTMKSAALNRAWASRRAHPAAVVSGRPSPNSTMRKPSWLIVPKARTCFRSTGRSARQPPTTMVVRPTETTSGRHGPASAKAGAKRATR